MAPGYRSNSEHLFAKLRQLALCLAAEVQKQRQVRQAPARPDLAGLVLSDEEIDGILHETLGDGLEGYVPPEQPRSGVLHGLEKELAQRTEQALENGVVMRLIKLEALFGLTAWETHVLLLCLAPELDLRYARLYAYLQDDVTKKAPTVDLALRLFCRSAQESMERLGAFYPQATLLRHELLRIHEDPYAKSGPLRSRFLQLDDRVRDYLLGSDELDPRLRTFARKVEPVAAFQDLVLQPSVRERLEALGSRYREEPWPLTLALSGPPGSGKKTVAQAFCRKVGLPLLVVGVPGLLTANGQVASLVTALFREAVFQGAALYFDDFDHTSNEPAAQAAHHCLMQELESWDGLTFVAGQDPWRPGRALDRTTVIWLDLPAPSPSQRRELWGHLMDGRYSPASDVDAGLLASKFHLTGGQIAQALATACGMSVWRRPEDVAALTQEDLEAACRWHSYQGLARLARKIQPRYTWDDIVLPQDQKGQLREICQHVKYQPRVYGDWGFDRKLAPGGLNVLFVGPSGTGKTMAAEIVAHELSLELYRIDLSTVVSKYIGETEKNLDRIFTEAEDSNAILFFDEADALFGKRSEVRDSHDRYANIEVSYLLQKMEEYRGIVILATNFRKNMDPAFMRRTHFAVEFPFPDEAHRLQIWQRMFPAETPLGQDVNFNSLARSFKLAGGNIRNIALSAAFLAAAASTVITVEHLTRAARRELQKMGKLATEEEFGSLVPLVNES